MPRPTNASVAYGSLTVVAATLVLLLLTDARSGAAVTGVGAGALVLGLLVAAAAAARDRRAAAKALPAPSLGPAMATGSLPRPRVGGGAPVRQRVDQHSLRR